MDCKYQCAVHALFALEQAVLITGTTTLGAGVIRSCAVGCMPILLLGRHQHMGRRWCVGGGQSAQLCPDDDCICCIGMHRHTYQPGEKSVVSSVGEPLLPPHPSRVCCHVKGLCSAVKGCKVSGKGTLDYVVLIREQLPCVSCCVSLCVCLHWYQQLSSDVDVAQLQVNAL